MLHTCCCRSSGGKHAVRTDRIQLNFNGILEILSDLNIRLVASWCEVTKLHDFLMDDSAKCAGNTCAGIPSNWQRGVGVGRMNVCKQTWKSFNPHFGGKISSYTWTSSCVQKMASMEFSHRASCAQHKKGQDELPFGIVNQVKSPLNSVLLLCDFRFTSFSSIR